MKNIKNKFPLVSIMATSFNTMVFIEKFMNSVMKTTYPNFEVLIIDDHSRDGSYEWLVENYAKDKRVRIVRNKRNLRLAKARTKGIKLARGKYVTLMDVDTVVDPSWIKESAQVLEKNPGIAAAQSVVYDLLEPNIIEFAGIRIIPQFGWVLLRDFGKKKLSDSRLFETFPGPTGIVYRKSIFKTLGYFDTKIGFNIDDVDFGFRFNLAGYRAFVVPAAKTYHLTFKPRSEREKVIKRLEWEFQFMKMPRIFIKIYEAKNVILYLPFFFLAAFLRSIRWMLRGDARPLFGLLWATLWNISILPDTLRERKRIQKLRKIKDSEVFKRVGLNLTFSIFKAWLSQIDQALSWSKRVQNLPAAKFLLRQR